MATAQQVQELEDAAHSSAMALLERIENATKETTSMHNLRMLAEARAWVLQPGQAHGSNIKQG